MLEAIVQTEKPGHLENYWCKPCPGCMCIRSSDLPNQTPKPSPTPTPTPPHPTPQSQNKKPPKNHLEKEYIKKTSWVTKHYGFIVLFSLATSYTGIDFKYSLLASWQFSNILWASNSVPTELHPRFGFPFSPLQSTSINMHTSSTYLSHPNHLCMNVLDNAISLDSTHVLLT